MPRGYEYYVNLNICSMGRLGCGVTFDVAWSVRDGIGGLSDKSMMPSLGERSGNVRLWTPGLVTISGDEAGSRSIYLSSATI